jgi:hypothetical protein
VTGTRKAPNTWAGGQILGRWQLRLAYHREVYRVPALVSPALKTPNLVPIPSTEDGSRAGAGVGESRTRQLPRSEPLAACGETQPPQTAARPEPTPLTRVVMPSLQVKRRRCSVCSRCPSRPHHRRGRIGVCQDGFLPSSMGAEASIR